MPPRRGTWIRGSKWQWTRFGVLLPDPSPFGNGYLFQEDDCAYSPFGEWDCLADDDPRIPPAIYALHEEFLAEQRAEVLAASEDEDE